MAFTFIVLVVEVARRVEQVVLAVILMLVLVHQVQIHQLP
jgi:hypothetical protein